MRARQCWANGIARSWNGRPEPVAVGFLKASIRCIFAPASPFDGCPLHCVRDCLAWHDVAPAIHLTLTEIGVKKRFHTEFSEDEAAAAYQRVVAMPDDVRAKDSAAESGKRE